MKRRSTGLSVRFFKVTIPTGTRGTASSTGKTLISGRVVGNLKTDVGKIERKRPDARRPIRVSGARANTVAHGASSPQARKASIAIVAISPSGGGSTQGSLTRSASSIRRRRAHGSLHAIATGKSRPHSPGRRSPCPRSTSRGIPLTYHSFLRARPPQPLIRDLIVLSPGMGPAHRQPEPLRVGLAEGADAPRVRALNAAGARGGG